MARLGPGQGAEFTPVPPGVLGGVLDSDGWSGRGKEVPTSVLKTSPVQFGFARRLLFVSPRFNLPSRCTTGSGDSESVE